MQDVEKRFEGKIKSRPKNRMQAIITREIIKFKFNIMLQRAIRAKVRRPWAKSTSANMVKPSPLSKASTPVGMERSTTRLVDSRRIHYRKMMVKVAQGQM
jgi:hypothetical protein